jgi:DNA polymerase-3 subunit beta
MKNDRKKGFTALCRLARGFKPKPYVTTADSVPGNSLVFDGVRAWASDGTVWLSLRSAQKLSAPVAVDEPMLRTLLKAGDDITIDRAQGRVNDVAVDLRPIEDHIPLPEPGQPMAAFEVNLQRLANVLRAAGVHDIRYYLNGLLFDFPGRALVATDGHRLHRYNAETLPLVPTPQNAEASRTLPILPRKAAELIADLKLRNVAWDGAIFAASNDDLELRVPAIDGTFPDYSKVLRAPRKDDVVVTLDPVRLASGLKQAIALGKARKASYIGVILDGATADLAVHVNGAPAMVLPDIVQITSRRGVLRPIGFAPAYLLDVAELVTAAATWRFSNAEKHQSRESLIVEEGDFTAVVMPMNL